MFKISVTALLIFLHSLIAFAQPKDASKERVTEVTSVPVSLEIFSDRIEALGTLKADESVEITANTAEKIRQIHFTDGQSVEKGDILIEMASNEEEALLREAIAAQNEARKQLNRIRPLLQSGAIAKSEYDIRFRELKTATARLDALKSKLQDQIITAPFAGVLGLRQVSEGEYVQPGEVLATLTKNHPLKLDFNVPAVFVRPIETGLTVVATTDAFPDESFTGEVTSLENQVDPTTRSIAVRALIANEQGRLLPGLLMTVAVMHNRRQSLALPEEAIVSEGQKSFVYVIDTAGHSAKVSKVAVKVGQRRPGTLEILDGLEEGQKVVKDGVMKIEDKASVKIIAGLETKSPETIAKEKKIQAQRIQVLKPNEEKNRLGQSGTPEQKNKLDPLVDQEQEASNPAETEQ